MRTFSEQRITQSAACHLDRLTRQRLLTDIEAAHRQTNAQSAAQPPDISLVGIRFRATQMIVAVQRLNIVTETSQRHSQRHRIGATAKPHHYAPGIAGSSESDFTPASTLSVTLESFGVISMLIIRVKQRSAVS